MRSAVRSLDRKVLWFFVVASLLPVLVAVSQVQSGAGNPKGWSSTLQSTDIGNPAVHGETKPVNDGMEVEAGGKDIWGTSDEFHFVYEKHTGDFDVAVRVASLTAPHLYSRAGLMARENLSADSRHVFFLVFPDNRPRHNNTSGYEYQYRAMQGGPSAGIYPPQNSGPPAFPVNFPNAWLRLKRARNQFTGFVSEDGKNWKEYGSYSLELPETLFLGLATTSHIENTATTARFEDLIVPHEK